MAVLIFCGLIYLVNHLGIKPSITEPVNMVLAILGLLAFALRVAGVALPVGLS